MLTTFLAFSSVLAVQSGGGTEALPPHCLRVIRPTCGRVQAIDVSPDGERILVGCADGNAFVYALATGELVKALPPKSKQLWDVEFDPRGERLLVVNADTASVWNAKTLELEHTLGPQKLGMMHASFSRDGSRIATGSCGNVQDNDEPTEVRVWDAVTGEQQALVENTGYRVVPTFSPDGKALLISADSSPAAQIFQLEAKRVSAKLTGHALGIAWSAWSPDGKSVLTVSADKTGRVWNPGTGQETRVLNGHTGYVTMCEFGADGKELATTSWVDRTTRVWNPKTGKARLVLEGHKERPTQAHFAPDGRAFASADAAGHGLVFDLAQGKVAAKLDGHMDIVSSLEFAPDSKRIVTGSFDGTVRVWSNPLAK